MQYFLILSTLCVIASASPYVCPIKFKIIILYTDWSKHMAPAAHSTYKHPIFPPYIPTLRIF